MTFYLRPQAEADLEDIALYIAEDNVQAAGQWIEDMHAVCQRLGEMPSMGVAKPAIRPGLRMLPAGSYLILYQQVDKGVEIVRVIHGARQWQAATPAEVFGLKALHGGVNWKIGGCHDRRTVTALSD